ncbi:hypothetical protein EDD85DRAFT_955778 [Armillaria nabsnona]|nr:hypothetical protein EDD85DRAFT_955778 [Armillaria nabsnona]
MDLEDSAVQPLGLCILMCLRSLQPASHAHSDLKNRPYSSSKILRSKPRGERRHVSFGILTSIRLWVIVQSNVSDQPPPSRSSKPSASLHVTVAQQDVIFVAQQRIKFGQVCSLALNLVFIRPSKVGRIEALNFRDQSPAASDVMDSVGSRRLPGGVLKWYSFVFPISVPFQNSMGSAATYRLPASELDGYWSSGRIDEDGADAGGIVGCARRRRDGWTARYSREGMGSGMTATEVRAVNACHPSARLLIPRIFSVVLPY